MSFFYLDFFLVKLVLKLSKNMKSNKRLIKLIRYIDQRQRDNPLHAGKVRCKNG
jgi:hypothetical protein